MTGTAGAAPRLLWLACCLSVGALLAACGGAGGDEPLDTVVPGGSQASYGLEVLTPDLPQARVDQPLAVTRLRAAGASPDARVTWSVWDGHLPAGVRLDEEGHLSGAPHDQGLFLFTVRASDGLRAGTRTLALAVDDFGLFVRSGLQSGEAWQGRPLVLATAGAAGPVVFETVHAESGGHWGERAPGSSQAVWQPGNAGGRSCVDQLRARDPVSGRSALLSVTVRPDPTARFAAAFGSTDVWYVNWSQKSGAHPYATDVHAALAAVGLRHPQSTDRLGTPADGLTELWIRVETLRALNVLFLRAPDGTAGASGLPVSFPFDEPGAGYGRPRDGTVSLGGAGRYSLISLLDGRQEGVLGTAFTDDCSNRLHENDTTAGGGDLGVFVNVLASYYRATYRPTELMEEPVAAADLPALRALLHEADPAGARYEELARHGRGFARVLAVVLAHEIGHSLGLQHDTAGGEDSIMAPRAPILPWSQAAFSAGDVAAMQRHLPGPGRMSAAEPTPHEHAEGVEVCAGRACNLLLPQANARRGRVPVLGCDRGH